VRGERRYYQSEARASKDGAALIIGGHGAVFNRWTTIAGLFEERVAPGAFVQSIHEDDVRALFNHDPSLVIGRMSAGTLTLAEDQTGLAYRVALPDSPNGQNVYVAVDRGDVRESSFSFDVLPDGDVWEWPEDPSGLPRRTLTKVRLYDVGPVTFPAYADADVSTTARSVLAAAEARGALPARRSAAELLEAARAAADEAAALEAGRRSVTDRRDRWRRLRVGV
jgi:HK97 family phage prohead protease